MTTHISATIRWEHDGGSGTIRMCCEADSDFDVNDIEKVTHFLNKIKDGVACALDWDSETKNARLWVESIDSTPSY